MSLFNTFNLGSIELKNRAVMAPMTRARATDNVPNDLMVEYYGQRASAGLIITEGTAPSSNGLGYARIPGLYNQDQIEGWKKITEKVHEQGSKIFVQLMHGGRIAHPANMEDGTEIVAPSAIALSGQIYTDSEGMQDHPVPKEMTLQDIEQARQEFVSAAKNAILAGFDGVEVHAANGFLIDQFINTASNKRTDNYGGSIENRTRFALTVTQKIIEAIGADRTGVRISPYGGVHDMEVFADLEDTYSYLVGELDKLDLAYVHIVEMESMGGPIVPDSMLKKIRANFSSNIIRSGGLDRQKAQELLDSNEAQLTAFARGFLSNPDFLERIQKDLPLNEIDFDTFYTPGEKGYTDYPVYKETGIYS